MNHPQGKERKGPLEAHSKEGAQYNSRLKKARSSLSSDVQWFYRLMAVE